METLGEKHPDSLMNMNDLRVTYTKQGRWQEAEKLGMQVLETRKRVLGEDHPDSLVSMGNPHRLIQPGPVEEAGELQERVLKTGSSARSMPKLAHDHQQPRVDVLEQGDGRRQRSYWCRW